MRIRSDLISQPSRFSAIAILILLGGSRMTAEEPRGSSERGFELISSKAYLKGDFNGSAFDALWAVWPEEQRKIAENASAAERRAMILARYGLHEPSRLGDDDQTPRPPVGYVADAEGQWAMNCFACHAGSVAGASTIYGLGNSHFAMHSLVSDLLAVKLRQFKRPSGLQLASRFFPLNSTDGTTNAVVFGIAVGASRDKDLNVVSRKVDDFIHHDMDAPPWWNVKKKTSLYCDGYAPKTHRVIMPFVMSASNDGPKVRSWEGEFRDVLAFIESVKAPKYPFSIDKSKAEVGEAIFASQCAACHGTYGDAETYPERIVDIDVVQTDPVRLTALTPEHRNWTKIGWLGRYGKDDVTIDPIGYLAPPLDGIWASAPYLHNGSVPTLWHLMHPSERPTVWRRSRDGYDRDRVGLEIEELGAVPESLSDAEKRRYRDSSRFGMSNIGHNFFVELNEAEKTQLLEYLKTL